MICTWRTEPCLMQCPESYISRHFIEVFTLKYRRFWFSFLPSRIPYITKQNKRIVSCLLFLNKIEVIRKGVFILCFVLFHCKIQCYTLTPVSCSIWFFIYGWEKNFCCPKYVFILTVTLVFSYCMTPIELIITNNQTWTLLIKHGWKCSVISICIWRKTFENIFFILTAYASYSH